MNSGYSRQDTGFLLHHMRHNPDCLAGFAGFEVDHDGVLAGLAAEEVDGIEVAVSVAVVGGDQHVRGVVDADDGLAFVVAKVEAVDVVAAEDDGLAVDGWGLIFGCLGKAYNKFFEVYGSFACFFGTCLHSFLAIALHHGEGQDGKNDGYGWFKDLHSA